MDAKLETQSDSLSMLKAACSTCSLRELCLPMGMDDPEFGLLDTVIDQRRSVTVGQHLYRLHDHFQALYAIRSGFFKTYELSNDGQEHINGFHMAGEIIGLDAINTERHMCNAIALDTAEVCVIPFHQFEQLLHQLPSFMHQFHRLLSREIGIDHRMMLVLGNMSAEQKLASFLINLSERLAARKLSATNIRLSMSREEIGNYLGLKLETVSRTLSKFQEDRLIRVERRNLKIIDRAGLQYLADRAGQAR